MNVCFLLGGFKVNGGIGRVVSIVSNELSKDEDFNIHAVSFYDNHKRELYSLNNKIKKEYLFNSPINMRNALIKGGILKLRTYLKDNNIDVLIACGDLFFPISVLSCLGLKTKCICWEHANTTVSTDHAFQTQSRNFGAKMSSLVITLTKEDKKNYEEKYGISNVVQIYNPIDENIFRYTNNYDVSSKKILSVGRLAYQKNFDLLIEVANKLLNEYSEWTWDIYGEGDLRYELQQKINNYGLQDKVILKGQVNDLYERYNEYSMFVMTSRYEGFPMTLLESMSNGLPLISFDISTGPNEIIENDINGYLIDAFDSISMKSKIKNLIEKPKDRERIASNNLIKCEDFKLSKIIRLWKQVLSEVAHN